MRAWNVLAIAALSDNADGFWVTQLFKQLKSFSAMYFNALWPYIKSAGPVPDSATADLNQAYLAIKLWLVIAKHSEEARRVGEPVYNAVWNELWPPFEGIVHVLEAEAQSGVSPVSFQASSEWKVFIRLCSDYGRFYSVFDRGLDFVYQIVANTAGPPKIGPKSHSQATTKPSSRGVCIDQGIFAQTQQGLLLIDTCNSSTEQ